MPVLTSRLGRRGATAAIIALTACSRSRPGTGSDTGAPASIAPSPRGYSQLVYHPPSGRLLLVGGEANRRVALNEVWSYRMDTDRWTGMAVDSTLDLSGVAAAYDRESDRIIVYLTTRLDQSAERGLTRRSETWAIDPTSGHWVDLHPDPAPFGLMGARMVYDEAADRIILFGGADFTRSPSPRFDETWAYDFNANSWVRRAPPHRPPGRAYFGMAYDARARRTLVFGGSLDPEDQPRAGELWSYDSAADEWESVTYTGTVQPDHHPAMVYGRAVDRTFYVVGQGAWAFDYGTRSWTPLPYDSAMGIRHFQAIAFDEAHRRLLLFGGGPQGLHYDAELWIYDPAVNRWALRR